MRHALLQDAAAATLETSTLSTSLSPSPNPTSTISPSDGWQQHLPQSDGQSTSIVINISDGGSTGRGILIGILSAFGSAGVAVLVLAIFFFFRYTNKGRILLDRIGRPGEFDDEQAFAREEAEALETMDEMQRAEYLRAKGSSSCILDSQARATNRMQPSFKPILPKPCRPIFPCPNSWLSKKRAYQPGNSNPRLKLPTASLRAEQRSSSTTQSAVCNQTFQSPSRTKSTTGKQRYTISQNQV